MRVLRIYNSMRRRTFLTCYALIPSLAVPFTRLNLQDLKSFVARDLSQVYFRRISIWKKDFSEAYVVQSNVTILLILKQCCDVVVLCDSERYLYKISDGFRAT